MNLRILLYELTARYHLSPAQSRALWELAGLEEEPAGLRHWLSLACAVLAAALLGLGVIFWLAANWGELGRISKFALLQGLLIASALAAVLRPAARPPLLLLAFLAQGGVMAFFGQTYQTGADPWQLFALWAVLGLPLALAARSDVLWVPLALVAMTAIALWTHAFSGRRWAIDEASAGLYVAGWLLALALSAFLGPLPGCRRITGAGFWSFRLALTLAVVSICLGALGALFQSRLLSPYPAAVLLLAGTGWGVVAFAAADILALGVVALALDVLLIAGLARCLFETSHGGGLGLLFVLGLLAAALVSATVLVVKRLAERAVRDRGAAR